MIRRGLFIMAAAVAGAALVQSALLAKPGVVKTREGQVYEGDVDDKKEADFVTVNVRGIRTQIARSDIASISDGLELDKEYQQRLAKLDAKDAAGRMNLARWAFAQRRYDLARDAADKALEVDPNSAEASNFLTLVQSQQRMERNRARAATSPATHEAATTTHANHPDWQVLTAGDMNRIRQEELRKTDTRVRFQFRNDVERRFLNNSRDFTIGDWRTMSQLDRALTILDRGDPQLRDDVIVASEPVAMLEYRRLVQPMVLANCATSGCHGGKSAGALVLNTTADANEAATYTNFYILQQYAQSIRAAGDQQSVFGGDIRRRMIDRAHPEESLLLQYGLPRNAARMPHPDVQNFRAAFTRGRQDTKYQAIAQWIGATLAPVEPNYGVTYDPPSGSAPTPAAGESNHAPASRPSRQR